MKTVFTLFENVAQTYAHTTAIQSATTSITYQELTQRVNDLSRTIKHQAPNAKIISLPTRRSIDQIVGVLAILKSGKAYLPLDLNDPRERLKYCIKTAGVSYCLSHEVDLEVIKELGLEAISFDFSGSPEGINGFSQSKIAYILYTSGSTGTPKGVAMGQEALVNLITWQNEQSIATKGTRSLQFAPLSFDVSFQEILCTLTTGGTLMLISEDMRRDVQGLLEYIDLHKINRLFLPFVALQALAEAATSSHIYPSSLEEIMTAGEQLKITPQLNRFFTMLPQCTLYNHYGPTECHVVSALKLTGNPNTWPALPSIGTPIHNVEIYILDNKLNSLPNGETGELCIAGACLAEAYVAEKELTEEKFIQWVAPNGELKKIYRTGDLASVLGDGNIKFLGRSDDQVKIRGHRIELGEVEAMLNALKGIKQAVVLVRERSGQKQLVAYLQPTEQQGEISNFREKVETVLPNYMLPERYIWLKEFPKTTSGKIDKKNLPIPHYTRPSSAPAYKRPDSTLEKNLVKTWQNILEIEEIGIYDNFFEMGGTSLLAQKTVADLQRDYTYKIPITKLYQYPTIATLAEFVEGPKKSPEFCERPAKDKEKINEDIAVIGMSGRFPGAQNIQEFWDLLCAGKETIRFFDADELDASIPSTLRNNPLYVRARGILDTATEFDADFFGLNPKIAQAMDPQQRVFLEIAWEALEQSGHLPEHYRGSVGVFAGCGNNTYYTKNILPNTELLGQVGDFQAMTLNEKDYLASRTAYQLDLKGPAISVFSACSTSLLAIAQAVQHLRSGQCDVALAGGASITAPIASGHLYQEGAMYSPDGHSRPFDAEAQGTVFSDGAGVVVLKNLDAAQRDGDVIYGIIKGIGINNDGRAKGSFTAPSAAGQADSICRALEDGQIDPSTISYIEAHGTGTPVGDPIEIEGLNMAFSDQHKKGFCALGSVKSNIGHLTAASGVAGFIKTVLALHYQKIPASLGFKKANPSIDFENSPFFVNNQLSNWPNSGLKRAGVSSFGVGGTNVHVVLEGFSKKATPEFKARPQQLITWSAKTENSMNMFAKRLADHLQREPGQSLADIAYTLHTTRAIFEQRNFVVADTADNAKDLILNAKSGSPSFTAGEVVFQFPGQGAQYLQMGLELYNQEEVYKTAIDTCADLLMPYLDTDIREIIYATKNLEKAEARLRETRYAQPALFVTGYALAQLWLSWNIKPTILCGHSVGEFVAAHLAGIFSLKDALKLIAYRGKLVNDLPGGSMLSLRMPVEELQEIVPKNLSIAAINSKHLCVLSGTHEAIEAFAQEAQQRNLVNRKLATSHAFHSYMMDPIVEDFNKIIQEVRLNRPQLPVVSSVTGTWMTDDEAMEPTYWSKHLRNTVRFADTLDTLLKVDAPLLLEMGPGKTLTTLAFQQASGTTVCALPSLPVAGDRSKIYKTLLHTLGELWRHGLKPTWEAFYAGQNRQKILLPTYAFDRNYCWAEAPLLSPLKESEAVINYSEKDQSKDKTEQMKPLKTQSLVIEKVIGIISQASGIDVDNRATSKSFLELGLDSLILTQLAILCKKEFELPITFRQLNEELATPDLLAQHIEREMPQDHTNLTRPQDAHPTEDVRTAEELIEHQKPFGASARIERKLSTDITELQQHFLKELCQSYNSKTKGSKAYTQQYRSYMADPRVVSGFKPLTKEMVYPILIEKSSGNRLWDIDGNEYLDALNGFGSCIFGHQPPFIKEVLHDQIEKGYEIGPQHPLAGEVCALLCEFTGHERAALCNTGSEAVLGAMRIARTTTGRSLIVAFSGSYHGINDEVIVRGSKKYVSFPAAPGILPEAVKNMLILDYGTDESLQVIRERAHELAAVLIEPVQSRRPEFQPVEFLHEVREITKKSGTTLIFDEVITGFRMHPGGAQALFKIQADLATYGKVIGGGMPIGAIVGKRKFMDALDGGFWSYGDDSFPEVGVTYFAGTFVRHPLALAAAKASLLYMQKEGPALQERLNAKAAYLTSTLNAEFKKRGLAIEATQFGSLWRLKFKTEIPYSELLFTLLREKGIHIWDGFPCFLSTAYTQGDVERLIDSVVQSTDALIEAGFFPKNNRETYKINEITPLMLGNHNLLSKNLNSPPMAGARLAKDQDGNPAWFVPDTSHDGSYTKIEI